MYAGQLDQRRRAQRSSRRADSSSVTVGGVVVIASAYSITSRSRGVNTSDSRQRGTELPDHALAELGGELRLGNA